MKKLLSASEIAQLKIPGMPTTRVAVNVMAKREGWEFETATGIGGTRRMYKLPERFARYLSPDADLTPEALEPLPVTLPGNVIGTVAGGSNRVDVTKLELAIKALNEWETTRNLSISAERRPAIIAILYDYLVKSEEEGGDGIEVVFRALG